MSRLPGRARITGEHFTHRYLWHVAETIAETGRRSETGGVFLLAANLFAYFALEAHLNDLGPVVCLDEWSREREFFAGDGGERYRGTLGKLHLLADRVGVELDRGRRPYQTLVTVDSQRDAVVHGRTERFDLEVTFKRPESIERVSPEIYAFSDEAFVHRAFEDLEALADSI